MNIPKNPLNVLIACEYSGIVRDEFALRGHNALSCDLLPGEIYLFKETAGNHYQGNVFDIINDGWDLMIGFPPCTYLSYAGNRWWNDHGRKEKRDAALKFFKDLYYSNIKHICLENPIGYIQTWKKPSQIINPFQFGEPYSKRTCLWLKNLPLLQETNIVEPIKKYYPNGTKKDFTDIIHNQKLRSKFWTGIAAAMAEQWTNYLDHQTSLIRASKVPANQTVFLEDRFKC